MRFSRTLAALFTTTALGVTLASAGAANAACGLNSEGGKIKHVVHISFDNVHLRRDNPNVPSDLEQIPSLMNFLADNGVLSGNHHTVLISHTADDILAGLTGVYGDRMGMAVSNSYGYFKTGSSVGFSSAFLYWTALGGDGKPQMIDELGKTAPAPWAPFTRAGCDVGAFSVANIEFESVPGDVRTVFGVGSPEDVAVTAALNLPSIPANQPARQAPATDYLGIAVHCAAGSQICSGPHARPDILADEPGGYAGFNALYGNVNVAPVLCQAVPGACVNGAVKDTTGASIADPYGRPGFPSSFNPTAAQSLGYAATMLEAGLPIVYLYIADLHDQNPLPLDPTTNKLVPGHAFGPGEAGYVAQAKAYDAAFATFFARLKADGITKENTLFVVAPDENDHFVGGAPSPTSCDGVTTPCTYANVGEIDADLDRLLATERNNTTPFSVHSDSAPTVYVNGAPAPTDPTTRTLEKDMNLLNATNPITGAVDKFARRFADQAELGLLHMVTASPARTPSFAMFGDPDYYYLTAGNTSSCTSAPSCVFEITTNAWNHGDFQPEITTTWLGMVGPGVKRLGRNDQVFSDHTDIRPTLLSLVGLKDDYVHDGRVLVEDLHNDALPTSFKRDREGFEELARVYKQLNAPLGSLGVASLVASTAAVTGDDAAYASYLARTADFAARRDALAARIRAALDGAEFVGRPLGEDRGDEALAEQARDLIAEMNAAAGLTATDNDR